MSKVTAITSEPTIGKLHTQLRAVLDQKEYDSMLGVSVIGVLNLLIIEVISELTEAVQAQLDEEK